jgi:beta-lactamase superfamily II metal-dependent hydrolase
MRAARIGLWCRAVCRLLACVALASQASRAQASGGRIYFIDIGQGASTLIVSPAGRTMLVDGGPDSSAAKVIALLNTLGITTVDYTVLTHYHVDHDAGLTGLINAGRVFGTAYDNGDDPSLVPPNAGTTLSAYNAYKAAIAAHTSVTRQTITPGTVVDLGGGMRVTCIAAGGKLLSGGEVTISNTDLNTESISVFVEYNDFDFLVSGDLTGGGSTSTASTPDVETFVAQQVGDVDVVQLNHPRLRRFQVQDRCSTRRIPVRPGTIE